VLESQVKQDIVGRDDKQICKRSGRTEQEWENQVTTTTLQLLIRSRINCNKSMQDGGILYQAVFAEYCTLD
jgi:hypothetical protein